MRSDNAGRQEVEAVLKKSLPWAAAVATSAWITGCALQPAAPPAAEVRSMALNVFGTVEPVQNAEVAAPRAALGRALFWDTRLSIDGKTA